MYAPFTPAYAMKTTSVATLVTTNARVRESRRSSLGRASADTPATTGRMPIPIASAPIAQVACSTMRSLQISIVFRHAVDACPIAAASASAIPTASVTAPTQSHPLQEDRHLSDHLRLPGQPEQPEREHHEEDGQLRSCERADDAQRGRGCNPSPRKALQRACDQPQRERCDGYASGSSTRIGAYARAGTATAAPAAASAYHFGTTIRASP